MEVIITATGPDNRGLADPIVHHVTGRGAQIAEIQMYDHDDQHLFAMLCRIRIQSADASLSSMRQAMDAIARQTGLSVRVWSPDRTADRPPRLAVACTYAPQTPRAVLSAVADGQLAATAPLVISNRQTLAPLADEFGAAFECIGDDNGRSDHDRLVELLDQHEIDYLVLARYMRILPAEACWQFAGGRIINLHHGLLPGFPGFRPYHDAHAARMLTFGATCHFIVPELDAGNQTIHQRTFGVPPGTPVEEVIRIGENENEPQCLVEGVRRVLAREVQLSFHRVVPGPAKL